MQTSEKGCQPKAKRTDTGSKMRQNLRLQFLNVGPFANYTDSSSIGTAFSVYSSELTIK